jgi:hypothetical protein
LIKKIRENLWRNQIFYITIFSTPNRLGVGLNQIWRKWRFEKSKNGFWIRKIRENLWQHHLLHITMFSTPNWLGVQLNQVLFQWRFEKSKNRFWIRKVRENLWLNQISYNTSSSSPNRLYINHPNRWRIRGEGIIIKEIWKHPNFTSIFLSPEPFFFFP